MWILMLVMSSLVGCSSLHLGREMGDLRQGW